MASSSIDARMLAWGGYLTSSASRSDKTNRWLICVNTAKHEIHIVQHEQDHAVYTFKTLMCVFANLKYENALMVFFNNGKAPIHIYLDSVQDRVAMQKLLSSIPKKKYEAAAIEVGANAEEQFEVFKKGKFKWASRTMVLVRNRILIFRDKSKSEYPLNMMSLLEPSMTFGASEGHARSVEIRCQERKFLFQLKDEAAVLGCVEAMKRFRVKMIGEAKYAQMEEMKEMSASKRALASKGFMVRQEMASRGTLMSSRFLRSQESSGSQRTVTLASGSKMTLTQDTGDKGMGVSMVPRSKQLDKAQRRLGFEKSFKPDTHQASIFLWGKARPPRLYPMHSDQIQPFRHDDMSKKRFIFIAAAKDGTHALGFTHNDWTFVWGENNETPAALGLGRATKSTLPFIISKLKKKQVIQVCCSASHGLALLADSSVYGWGKKSMTNLPADVNAPRPLPFLSALGTTAIACSSTHSCAYSGAHSDVFMWGMPGPWLGFEDDSRMRTFGRVEFHESIAADKKLTVSKVDLGPQYSLILLSDGMLCTCGVNEHGRMGIGEDMAETTKPVFVDEVPQFCDLSAGPYHAAFLSRAGEVFTCGVGTDFRLGHGDEETVWVPRKVQSLSEVKIVRLECVEDRTFAITKFGCVLMWGVETVNGMVHTAPFVYEYMRPFRIYQICGAKDFTVALGVHSKSPVPKPEIDAYDDPRQKRTHKAMVAEITDVMADSSDVGGAGFAVTGVMGGYVQVAQTVAEPKGPTPGMAAMRGPYGGSAVSGFGGGGMPPPFGMGVGAMGASALGGSAMIMPPVVGMGGMPPPGGGGYGMPPPGGGGFGMPPPHLAGGGPPPHPSSGFSRGAKARKSGGSSRPKKTKKKWPPQKDAGSDSDDEFFAEMQAKHGGGPPPVPGMGGPPPVPAMGGGGPPPHPGAAGGRPPIGVGYGPPMAGGFGPPPMGGSGYGPPMGYGGGFGGAPMGGGSGYGPPMGGSGFGPPPMGGAGYGPPPGGGRPFGGVPKSGGGFPPRGGLPKRTGARFAE